MNGPMFSRSTRRTSDDLVTEEVKVRVSEEIKDELSGLAVLHGMSLSEYLRTVLTSHCRGQVYMAQVCAGSNTREGRE